MATIAHSPSDKNLLHSRWSSPHTLLIFAGILSLVLGIFAMMLPLLGSLLLELMLGWVLIFAGIARLVHTFQDRKHSGFWFSLFMSVFTAATGFVLVLYPMQGLLALAWLMGVYFVATGILAASWCLAARKVPGWGWMLTQSLVNILLGVLILSGWPATAFWILGLYVGIDLIVTGTTLLTVAHAAKKLEVSTT